MKNGSAGSRRGLVDARCAPVDALARRLQSGALLDPEVEAQRGRSEIVGAHAPADRASGPGRVARDPTTEHTRRRLSLVHDRDELHVGVSERDDAIRGPPTRMTSTGDRVQAVLALEHVRRTDEVGDGDEEVIEPQACAETAPAPTASSDAWKSVLSILPW